MQPENQLLIKNISQASALLKPYRLEIIKMLDQPRTCTELAEVLKDSPQKIYYHIKILEKAGLVKKVDQRQVRGIMEGIYQAAASSYWLSPEMVEELGGSQQAKNKLSLQYLIGLAQQVHNEVAQLAQQPDDEPSTLGISAQIELRDASDREAFMAELSSAVKNIAERYGNTNGDQSSSSSETFQLMVACYPQPSQQ